MASGVRYFENAMVRDWLAEANVIFEDSHYHPQYHDDKRRDDGTVYVGGTGVALALWRHASVLSPAEATAALWQAQHLLNATRFPDQSYTFLTGAAGFHAVSAAVAFSLALLLSEDDAPIQGTESVTVVDATRRHKATLPSSINLLEARDKAAQAVIDLVPSALQDAADECDLMYGRAGLIYALLFVYKYSGLHAGKAGTDSLRHKDILAKIPLLTRQLVLQILARGKERRCATLPITFYWHGKPYLGAAHGLVGIVHTLLLADTVLPSPVLQPEEKELVVSAVVELLRGYRASNGNILSTCGSNSDGILMHWCHGAPGAVMLVLRVCEAAPSRAEELLPVALDLADAVWRHGLLKKVGDDYLVYSCNATHWLTLWE